MSDMSAPSRLILITGGSRRLGADLAESLLHSGHSVVIHTRTPTEKTRALEAKAPGRAWTVEGDLREESVLFSLLETAQEKAGAPPDTLINNAAVFQNDTFDTLTPESLAFHMNVNLKAPLFLMQGFARTARKERDNVVVNLMDQKILAPTGQYVSYTASKGGLWTLSLAAARSLAPAIRVNGVAPGLVRSGPGETPETFEKLVSETPLGRKTDSKEICQLVKTILNTPSMTGQLITLDSGMHFRG